MKKILKSILSLTLIVSLVSCEDEQDLLFLTPEGSFQILTPTTGDEVVLDATTPLNPGLTLSWEDANYGSTATEITYEVEIDKTGDEFDTPLVITSTTNSYITVTSDALNSAVAAVGLTPFSQGSIDIRIKASVGIQGSEVQYSNVINYLVTPYSTDLPKLSVPGNHQGWNPPTAPTLAASAFGETDYEGYVWLDGGFKFLAPDSSGAFNWGNTDWGDDGSFSGVLVEQDETDCSASAGYYRVNADTAALTYSTTLTNWGIIGAATPGGWDASTPLTYNPDSKMWEGVMALGADEFKFRANDAWTINYGGDPAAMTQD
ncbi:MAG: SusE domain-containing protein, partial [Flavobacterium sp.]|nr:SusE domain-containing protein [Flavobacterium sp.]